MMTTKTITPAMAMALIRLLLFLGVTFPHLHMALEIMHGAQGQKCCPVMLRTTIV
jgi:hypothetical protein